ncbi:hypothetical protein CUJ91_03545 [Paraburkholderia graminis]|nr:hypothetical protein CUJ91_03545 [Paraburkholderia graminis]
MLPIAKLTAKKTWALTQEAVKQVVEQTSGMKSQAAANLGIPRQSLYRLLNPETR